MIGQLTGAVLQKTLKGVLIDCGGVGYQVLMPLRDLGRVGAVGERATVRIHTYVREDAIVLYGFCDDNGRETFATLLSVTGVGPKMALTLLGGLDPGELAAAINGKDLARLGTVPGVGKKTAERLCVELAGKLMGRASGGAVPSGLSQLDELKSALINLGYRPAAVEKVSQALGDQARAGGSVEELIREGLRLLRSPA